MFAELLERIAIVFARESIPYMVIGGQAVLAHGEPRLTKDIDITIGLDTDQLSFILKLSSELHLKPMTEKIDEFVHANAVLPLSDTRSGIRVDIIFSFMPYERDAIIRSKKFTIGKTQINFASVEDTILHKLFAGRPRDIEDVRGIIKLNRKIDTDYLNRWLQEFMNVTERNLIQEFNDLLNTYGNNKQIQ